MISKIFSVLAKKYRLSEREVKKVLHKGKPFFSYSLVFRHFSDRLPYSRYAIVIGGKSTPNAVVRNMYRRAFYKLCEKYTSRYSGNIVCIISAKTKLTKDSHNFEKICSEFTYILDKKIGKNI